jgi:hypothetical protein
VPTIEDALELLQKTGPEFGGGLSNHGPMAAEALVTLGCEDAVIPWVERYRRNLDEQPSEHSPISKGEWREALGEGTRVGDWVAFFDRELAERPWRSVLDEWVVRLAPGLIAAGTHGLIRTAHAVRSLEGAETGLRLHELAAGLGYWAARYRALPERVEAPRESLPPSRAIFRVGLVPQEARPHAGLIVDHLRPLEDEPEFADIVNLVDANADPDPFLSDLTETFARVYLANVDPTAEPIGLIHAVTGPSAVRLVTPHVSPESAALLRRYAWQAAAAIYAAFGQVAPDVSEDAPPLGFDSIVDAAVATGDPHAIKFAEACLREHALNPSPAYLRAASDAATRLAPA